MGLINGDESPVAVFPGAVTQDACRMLLSELASVQLTRGQMTDGDPHATRAMQVGFLPREHWAGQIVWGAAQQANEDLGWRYAISAVESIQFGVYGVGDFHDWHRDSFSHGETVRKLTVVVMLEDGDAYAGGDLELLRFGQPSAMTLELPREPLRQRGSVVVFPSYLPHRVTEVTFGERRTLVAWVLGPRFQ